MGTATPRVTRTQSYFPSGTYGQKGFDIRPMDSSAEGAANVTGFFFFLPAFEPLPPWVSSPHPVVPFFATAGSSLVVTPSSWVISRENTGWTTRHRVCIFFFCLASFLDPASTCEPIRIWAGGNSILFFVFFLRLSILAQLAFCCVFFLVFVAVFEDSCCVPPPPPI